MTYEELAYMGVIPTNNELYHHGILGMRWGRKNGPPYPLPNSRHSSSEKRAGWKDSLASVAKATGKGVATLAKGTARAVKGTVGGVNKASIRLGLKPKKMMTNEELDAEIERIRKEDILKHLRGKKTDSDRLAIKLDKKSKRREMMKNVVQETLKTIGTKVIGEGLATDLKNRLNLASNKRADKWAVERAELYPDFEFGKEGKGKKKDKGNTQTNDTQSTDNQPKEKTGNKGGSKLEETAKQDIYKRAVDDGVEPTAALKLANNLSAYYGKDVYDAAYAENARRDKNAAKYAKAQETMKRNREEAIRAQTERDRPFIDAQKLRTAQIKNINEQARSASEADVKRAMSDKTARDRIQKSYIVSTVKAEVQRDIEKIGGKITSLGDHTITYRNTDGELRTRSIDGIVDARYDQYLKRG